MTTEVLQQILLETDDFTEFLEICEESLVVEPFYEFALSKIHEKQLKFSTVFKRGMVSKSMGYKIIKGLRTPSRDLMVQLAFGIGLDVMETNRLLMLGKKAPLYVKDQRDAAILYCINQEMSLIDCEEMLLDLGFASLVNESV
jgi:hypothetical protein